MKFALKVATIAFAIFALSQFANAQDLPPGGFDPGTIDPGTTNPGNGGQDGQVLDGGTTGTEPTEFNADNLGPQIPEIEDTRGVNGFIGRNAAAIAEQGFVGQTADGITGATGESQNTGGGGRTGGGGGAATGLSFTVSRSNVRARVRPNFSFTAIPTAVIQNNFQRRVQKLPNLRTTVSQSINVSIEGTTATLSGQASNQEAIDKMVGQLRMEPGVYRIVNQVEIQGQTQVGQVQPARQ